MNTRPVAPPDRDTAGWWAATADGVLMLQRCRACGVHQHYPRAVCTRCGGDDLGFVPSPGSGTVETFTVVHRAPDGWFTPPYVVAIVRLDEGVRLLTTIVGPGAAAVTIGARVGLAWEPLADGRALPVFELRENGEADGSSAG